MPEPAAERLAEIQARPFEDLTPDQQLTWMTADPSGYYQAASLSAAAMVERETATARRRRAAANLERLLRPLRRLVGALGRCTDA